MSRNLLLLLHKTIKHNWMKEVKLKNGQGLIDILFDDFASCLIVNKALAVNWFDCRGSIGEYYAISDLDVEDRNRITEEINATLTNGNESEKIEVVCEFLKLFTNGKYRIYNSNINAISAEILKSEQVTYSSKVPKNEQFSGRFYPDYRTNNEPHIYSITNSKINNQRVEYYSKLIESGIMPTIVTFQMCNTLNSEYSRSYILDGHHKLEAYLKLKKNAPIISILKLSNCKGMTSSLLNYVKPILKDFEYKHLFKNNGENILEIDFINNKDLTDDLDEILKNSKRIDLSIIRVLKKYVNSSYESTWLERRLSILKSNMNLSSFNLNKKILVYSSASHPEYGRVWGPQKVNKIQLNEWILKEIMN